MSTDAHFLAAVAAAALDRLPRLVYADWLDEQNDPRGELIRIEDAMLDLPPYSDRFWELHAHRDAMAVGHSAEWLTAIRVGCDVVPVFAHGWPDDERDRWRLVRIVAERLGSPVVFGDDTGDMTAELALLDLLDDFHGTGGRLRAELDDTTDLRQQLVTSFPSPNRIAGVDVYEKPGLIVRIDGQDQVTISAQAAVTPSEIPAFLFQVSEDGRHVSGLFVPEVFREPDEPRIGPYPPLRWLRHPAVEAYNRGHRYWRGQGGYQISEPEAIRWFQYAVDLGYAKALTSLGAMYLSGVGGTSDPVRAADLFRRAADRGDPLGSFNLGTLYRDGDHLPRDDAEVVRHYLIAADKGEATAMYCLGYFCETGRQLLKDLDQAVRWYRRAAEGGERLAMFALARLYRDGVGVEKSVEQMLLWFRRAAEAGCPYAQYELGHRHYNGADVEKDYAMAVHWIRLAAENGHPAAMTALAICYKQGLGVERDPEQVQLWQRRAADCVTPPNSA